jgi:hypothetical protein
MQLTTHLKNVRRHARLELRMARLGSLTERATAAKDNATVAALEKEAKRRIAEINYLATRIEADVEDHPEWGDISSDLQDAVSAGARGSQDAKAIMAASLGAAIEPAAETATAE